MICLFRKSKLQLIYFWPFAKTSWCSTQLEVWKSFLFPSQLVVKLYQQIRNHLKGLLVGKRYGCNWWTKCRKEIHHDQLFRAITFSSYTVISSQCWMIPKYQDCKVKQWHSSPTFHLIVIAALFKWHRFRVFFTDSVKFWIDIKKENTIPLFLGHCGIIKTSANCTLWDSCLAVKNARGEQVGTGEVFNSQSLEIKGILKSSNVSGRHTPNMDFSSCHWIQAKVIGSRCSSGICIQKITNEMHSGL